MKIPTSIIYVNIDPDFHHPACPVLFGGHDLITSLEDCPFPLKTDTFEVLAFGENIGNLDVEGRDRTNDTFALVRYEKLCGHTVEERIPFQEGVQDFSHYGTEFVGAEYSIRDWERRIEYFRTILPCDVCQMADRTVWLRSLGEGPRSVKKCVDDLRSLLVFNYGNWEEFVDLDEVEKKLNATKHGSYYPD